MEGFALHWRTALLIGATIALLAASSSNGLRSSTGSNFPLPHVSAIPANLAFPVGNLSLDDRLDGLAAFLVSALGLPPVNETFRNGRYLYMCCLYDMNGHMMPMENGSSAVVEFQDNVGMNVEYSSTGRFMELNLIGSFGTPLPSRDWTSMVQRVRDVANHLGLAAFPLSFQSSNATGSLSTDSRTTIAAFSDPYTLPVVLGNQLIVTFDVNRGIAVGLQLFPWFTSPPASVSSAQATLAALTYLNETVVSTSPTLANGSWLSAVGTYLGLDFARYALVYDVEATYTADSHNPPGYPTTVSYSYRVWVDAGTGAVAYWVWVFHLGGPLPGTPPWILWIGAGIALSGLVALVLVLRRRRAAHEETPPRGFPPGPQS